MNPYQIILNPAAGHGNGARALPGIEAALRRQGLAYDLTCTQNRGHAIELAAQAARAGAEVIVSAGGDGTLNEVVNGVMQGRNGLDSQPAIGVLCVGRGNDLAGSIGIPAGIEEGCQLIKAAPRRRIDVGRVTGGIFPQGRYFINCVGIGFDAVTTIEVAKLPRWGGFLSFVIAIFKTIFLYNRAPTATIEFGDQTITQRSLMISMMNGVRLGGGFYMTPGSKPDDGLIDLCIAEQMSSLQIIRLVPHFTKGTHVTQKRIRMGRAAAVRITALDGPLPAHTDGEIFSTDGRFITVEMLPRQVEVICPLPGGEA